MEGRQKQMRGQFVHLAHPAIAQPACGRYDGGQAKVEDHAIASAAAGFGGMNEGWNCPKIPTVTVRLSLQLPHRESSIPLFSLSFIFDSTMARRMR